MTAASSPPLAVYLLLDAFAEFARAADSVPAPGRGGALGRLSAGSWIVAHVALHQDTSWNVRAQQLPDEEWLASWAEALRSDTPPAIPPFMEARQALDRVFEQATRYLEGLTEEALAAPLPPRPGTTEDSWTVGGEIAHSIAHVFVHAGELATIASLVGAPDLDMPRLRYVPGVDH